MRRVLLILSLLCGQLALLAAPAASLAQSDLLFGQQHYYSVTMRGNGEAVITARIVLTNTTDNPLSSFAFEVPQLKVADMQGYQQSSTTSCLDYLGTKNTEQSTIAIPCDRYSTQGGSTSTYGKLKIKDEGAGKYRAELPTSVKVQESTTLLLGYSGKGYAKQSLGAYSFVFQTLKVSERVTSATVAVDVDSDLYLLGGKSSVNYASDTPTSTSLSGSSMSSKALDSIASGIGYGGGITKQTSNLAAGESLSVKGTYADAAWKLYPGRLAVLVLLGVGLLALAVWLVVRLRRPRKVSETQGHLQPAILDPRYITAGLGTAGMVGLLTWGISYYGEVTLRYGTNDSFQMVLTALIAVLAYVLVVVGPVIWLTVQRRDWRVAVYVIVWQVAWLLVLLLVYQLGIRPLLLDTMPSPTIEPMMDGGSAGMKAN